jgi:hypothetical protein
MAKANVVPNIDLSQDKRLRGRLRKARGEDGMLRACKLIAIAMDLQQVHNVLEALPLSLLHQGDIKPLIVDTGCSHTFTQFGDDFIPGTFKTLCHPNWMDGIGWSREATFEGHVRYDVIND